MSSGPKSPNRKSSVTSLIQSSLASGLSIVPESGAGATVLETTPEQAGYPIKKDRRQRTSQTRLNFLSKSSAGSASSIQQARLPKQSSIESTGMTSPSSITSPMSVDQHRAVGLQTQGSSTSLNTNDSQ